MPSYQYLREESPNLPSNEPPPEYTKKEKAKNWWYYHRALVVGILIGVLIIVYFIVSSMAKTQPDYTIGVISSTDLPMELTEKLSQELIPFFDDRNGDGQVVIDIIPYGINYDQEQEKENATSTSSETFATPADPYSQMAGVTKMAGALASNDQFIFLVDSSQSQDYQEAFGIFGNPDGTIPEQGANLNELAPLLKNCPVLSQLNLTYTSYLDTEIDGQSFLENFYITLRPVYGSSVENQKDSSQNWEKDKEIYELLTKNATY